MRGRTSRGARMKLVKELCIACRKEAGGAWFPCDNEDWERGELRCSWFIRLPGGKRSVKELPPEGCPYSDQHIRAVRSQNGGL